MSGFLDFPSFRENVESLFSVQVFKLEMPVVAWPLQSSQSDVHAVGACEVWGKAMTEGLWQQRTKASGRGGGPSVRYRGGQLLIQQRKAEKRCCRQSEPCVQRSRGEKLTLEKQRMCFL